MNEAPTINFLGEEKNNESQNQIHPFYTSFEQKVPIIWVLKSKFDNSKFTIGIFQSLESKESTEFKDSIENPTLIKNYFKELDDKAQQIGIEPPNHWVKELLKKILDFLSEKSLSFEFLNPSHEGGIVIEFQKDNNYFLTEIFNDNEIVFLKRSQNGEREVWDLTEENIFQTLEIYLK